MQLQIKIDPCCTETTVIVITDAMKDEVNQIVERLSENHNKIIAGFLDKQMTILEQSEILRIYSENGKVFAQTNGAIYSLRLRLYEVEQRLDPKLFVRVSNSEIINLKMAKCFDLNIAGSICVYLKNGTKSYVSRRYVSKIKEHLGI